MEELNTAGGQQRVFGFLAIPEIKRRYMEKPRFNVRKSGDRPRTKEEAFSWKKRQTLTVDNITSVIPPKIDFILVDQQQIQDYLPAQYRAIPFLERNGVYWGPAPDDTIAIRELNRLRQSGAQFIIFAWTAFWWLDYYAGFCNYLRSNYRCLIENDRIVGFDLRTAGKAN
jgi:hypothetical protein